MVKNNIWPNLFSQAINRPNPGLTCVRRERTLGSALRPSFACPRIRGRKTNRAAARSDHILIELSMVRNYLPLALFVPCQIVNVFLFFVLIFRRLHLHCNCELSRQTARHFQQLMFVHHGITAPLRHHHKVIIWHHRRKLLIVLWRLFMNLYIMVGNL